LAIFLFFHDGHHHARSAEGIHSSPLFRFQSPSVETGDTVRLYESHRATTCRESGELWLGSMPWGSLEVLESRCCSDLSTS
jgi:hypothetical protein